LFALLFLFVIDEDMLTRTMMARRLRGDDDGLTLPPLSFSATMFPSSPSLLVV